MNRGEDRKKSRKIIVISAIGIVLVTCTLLILLGGLFGTHQKVAKTLKGTWLRSDGTYSIKISEVEEDGKMAAAYYNPKSINVGRSGWRINNKELQIFVELQDKNYPGSIYQLTYDEEKKILIGTYYQALYQQTFEVYFNKVK